MRFTIQEHQAKRAGLHWDLRLQLTPDGKMTSWAIPKHKLPDKGERLLLIPVEDHELSYQAFEGEIAEGYGAGTVKLVANGDFELFENGNGFTGFRLPGYGCYQIIPFKDKALIISTSDRIPPPEINGKVSTKLRLLGDLVQLSGESVFKKRAYDKAADHICTMSKDISSIEDPSTLSGIGKSIALKIIDIVKTGTCPKLDQLTAEYGDMLKVLAIPGIGPKTAQKLHQQGIRSIEQLREQVAAGKITDKRIVEGLITGAEKRISLGEAQEVAEEACGRILESMGDVPFQMSVAGSLRRQRPTIGDVDIIISSDNIGAAMIAAKAALDRVVEVGATKVSGGIGTTHVDIRVTPNHAFGAMQLYFTGSKMFNIECRKIAMSKDWTLNEYGLWDGATCLASKTEREILDKLGVEWVEPYERETT